MTDRGFSSPTSMSMTTPSLGLALICRESIRSIVDSAAQARLGSTTRATLGSFVRTWAAVAGNLSCCCRLGQPRGHLESSWRAGLRVTRARSGSERLVSSAASPKKAWRIACAATYSGVTARPDGTARTARLAVAVASHEEVICEGVARATPTRGNTLSVL